MDNETFDKDRQITSIADAVIKLQELRHSNKNLNEPDIEEKFACLSLAFKTDQLTLNKRLELQQRQRDVAEKDIVGELKALRETLNALNQLCSESDMREIITKTQQNVDIVQQVMKRMCSRSETYGAIQQEERMNCAFETMLNYIEHLKLLHDKEHLELEEYRRLLAEHHLLPEEQSALDDDSKRALAPRSQSLSSSSKPMLLRRGSVGTFLQPGVTLENERNNNAASSYSGWNCIVKQKTESRAVCLLSNMSPKCRRSSLPVGPLAHHPVTRSKLAANERRQSQIAKSNQLTRTESEESTNSKPESDYPPSLEERSEDVSDDGCPRKDSR